MKTTEGEIAMNVWNQISILVSAVMNSNKIGHDSNYDSKDFFFSDSHILTVSIISIFAVILAIMGVCFFFKMCKLCNLWTTWESCTEKRDKKTKIDDKVFHMKFRNH